MDSRSWIKTPERWTSRDSLFTLKENIHRHSVAVDHFREPSEVLLPERPAGKKKKRRETHPKESVKIGRLDEDGRVKRYQKTLNDIKLRGFSISEPPAYLSPSDYYPFNVKMWRNSKRSTLLTDHKRRGGAEDIMEEGAENELDLHRGSAHDTSSYVHPTYQQPLVPSKFPGALKQPGTVPPQQGTLSLDFQTAARLNQQERIRQRRELQRSLIVSAVFCLPITFIIVIVILLIILF